MEVKNFNDDNVVFCRRCGKPLKDAHSKALGFGRKCYVEFKKEQDAKMHLFDVVDGDDIERTD